MYSLAYVSKYHLFISTLNFMFTKKKNNGFHCSLIGTVGELQNVFVCVRGCACVKQNE